MDQANALAFGGIISQATAGTSTMLLCFLAKHGLAKSALDRNKQQKQRKGNKMIRFIALPRGRWCIENNNTSGPSASYESCAFWPNDINPELIGHSAYFGDERVWSIKQREEITEFLDKSS